jgi:hypothetical protein
MRETWKKARAKQARRSPAKQEYAELTVFLKRLNRFEAFLLDPQRPKSNDPLTRQVSRTLTTLHLELSRLRGAAFDANNKRHDE